jgi:hypothetical protein
MKWNPLCEKCVRECKQQAGVTMLSCPAFKEGGRNLDMFDIKGNIRKTPKKKSRPAAADRNRKEPAEERDLWFEK